MSITLKTHKMLWGRAANRCAFPDCRRELVMDASETDDESLIGEACHIVARESSGPRGNSSLTEEQRDKYGNLILLCNLHHKVVDDQTNTYTVQLLNEMKATHENWVQSSLQGFNEEKQRDDELYAGYIEEWAKRADIENWLNWTSHIFESSNQTLSITREKEIGELCVWIFSRVWPSRYPELNASFENFQHILQDFRGTFAKHSVEKWGRLMTEKFYKSESDVYNPNYRQQADEYEFHVYLLQDLILELTRAANYICDRVRQFIDPIYRLREGVLIVQSGLHSDLSYHFHRPEYREHERVLHPYKGLEQFKKDRFTRDEFFGDKTSEYNM